MDENRIKGAVRNAEGKNEEEAGGGLTGDARTKLEGKLEQGAGKVQGAFGSTRSGAEGRGTSLGFRRASLRRQPPRRSIHRPGH